MNQKDLIYLIGIVTLVAFAFYIIFGVLKESGMGLSSLGNNVVEGMTDKAKEKFAKKLEKANENMDKFLEEEKEHNFVKHMANVDNETEGFDEIKESIHEIVNLYVEIKKNMFIGHIIEDLAKGKRAQLYTKKVKDEIDDILRFHNFSKFLEEQEDVNL